MKILSLTKRGENWTLKEQVCKKLFFFIQHVVDIISNV